MTDKQRIEFLESVIREALEHIGFRESNGGLMVRRVSWLGQEIYAPNLLRYLRQQEVADD